MIEWTLFWDMHSGGGTKEGNYDKIYIEAPQEEAEIIFYNRFRHNPNRVTCTCCGADYAIAAHDSLEQASGYPRNCEFGYFVKDTQEYVGDLGYKTPGYEYVKSKGWLLNGQEVEGRYIEKHHGGYGDYLTVEEYVKSPDVLVISAEDIKPEERVGEIPEQGYVWKD
jgi:hypothetical protein